jgi:MFS family permease
MDNAGGFVGPLVAAFLLKIALLDERSVFLLAAVPGIAAVVLLLLAVPNTARPLTPAVSPRAETGSSRAPLPRTFWTVVVIFGFFTLANSTDAFLLLRAQQAGVETWQLPLFWSFFQGVKAATGVPGGALADRLGRVPAIALGWLVYALAYTGLAFVASPLGAWGLVAFYALFYGLTEGAERALVADLVPETLRGRAYGVFHAAIGIAALPASVLFGFLWQRFGARAAFSTGAVVALASAVLLWAATSSIRRRRLEGMRP